MDLLPPRLHLKLLQEHPGALFQVQRIHVQTSDPDTSFQNIPTHLSYQLGSHLTHRLVIVLDGQKDVPEMLGNDNALPLDPGHELLPRLNRHDTGNDRDSDPSCSDPLDPVYEDADVVEHLSENEVASRIDLGFEVFHLFALVIFSLGGLWVTLGETGDGNIKVIAVFRSDVFDEIDGFAESTGGSRPFRLTIRRISSKGQDVLTTVFLGDLD